MQDWVAIGKRASKLSFCGVTLANVPGRNNETVLRYLEKLRVIVK